MDRIQAGFVIFHERNPKVYAILVDKAREYQRAGRAVGIGHLWEIMRWEMFIATTEPETKLPNNYRSRYARLIMEREVDLAGFFRTAELRCIEGADGVQAGIPFKCADGKRRPANMTRAFEEGREARKKERKTRQGAMCPYSDDHAGRATWRRAWRAAWFDGFEFEKRRDR